MLLDLQTLQIVWDNDKVMMVVVKGGGGERRGGVSMNSRGGCSLICRRSKSSGRVTKW